MIVKIVRKFPTAKQHAYEERPTRKQDKRIRRIARSMKAYQEQQEEEAR